MTNTQQREAFEAWWGDQESGAPTQVFNTEKDMAFAAWKIRDVEIAKLTAERDELAKREHVLREAGKALVERWDSPKWKDLPHTAIYIDEMQQALSTPDTSGLIVCKNKPVAIVTGGIGEASMLVDGMPSGTYLYVKENT